MDKLLNKLLDMFGKLFGYVSDMTGYVLYMIDQLFVWLSMAKHG